MKQLFGTDGIRGVAGESPLDPPTVRKFGAALAEHLEAQGSHPARVVLGRDTRESGPWLRDAVAAGFRSRGGDAIDAGVISTPGLAYVTRGGSFDAGVMISASHNPFLDNGLKVFAHTGTKLPDTQEREIEDRILDPDRDDPGESGNGVALDTSLSVDYVRYLEGVVAEGRLKGLRLVLDCANGSASELAPTVFRHHGAEITTLGNSPDGRNINLDCGSLHLDRLAEHVCEGDYDLGIAFDGDADRALAVDRKGRVVDGDYILYLCGRRLKRSGALRGDKVVATVMSNFWLERQLADEGVSLLRAPVGDKYVLERMLEEDAVIGGEQSGHVIFLDRSTTGDGILTGLMLVDSLLDDSEKLETVLDRIRPCPQILINVRVKEKPDLRAHPTIGPAVAEVEEALAETGRVVLRYSGTEPLARVMVEGTDEEPVKRHATELAATIEKEIGE
jgi:phosphoglucosamine mutase